MKLQKELDTETAYLLNDKIHNPVLFYLELAIWLI